MNYDSQNEREVLISVHTVGWEWWRFWKRLVKKKSIFIAADVWNNEVEASNELKAYMVSVLLCNKR
jgi:hypothetical protein